MAFKLRGGFPDNFTIEVPVTAGTAIAQGVVLAISGNVVATATGSDTIHTIVGVSANAIGTAATSILMIPVTDAQIWEVGTKNNTAANQLFESAVLDTGAATIDNTSSDVTGPTGVFTPFAIVGAAGDKKMLGQFTRLQSTST